MLIVLNVWVFLWDVAFLILTLISVLTLWAPQAAGSGTRGCRGQSPLLCTHEGRACKNHLLLKILNELSENVSFDFHFEFALSFEKQPFKVAFFYFVFLMPIFQSIPGLNGLSQWGTSPNSIIFTVTQQHSSSEPVIHMVWDFFILWKVKH